MLMMEDGGPGGGPVKVVIAVTDVLSGLNATIGILRPSRLGTARVVVQQIDIALLDSIVQFGANPDRHLLHHRQNPNGLATRT